jgi:hypothetical protein
MPARAVTAAKIAAQAVSRFETSLCSMVTMARLAWMAVAMVSRRESIAVVMDCRWSWTSLKYLLLWDTTAGTRTLLKSLARASVSGATEWRSFSTCCLRW